MKIKSGTRVLLPRSEARPDLPAMDEKGEAFPDTLRGIVQQRTAKSARTWLVRWELDGKVTILSTAAISSCQNAAAPQPSPAAFEASRAAASAARSAARQATIAARAPPEGVVLPSPAAAAGHALEAPGESDEDSAEEEEKEVEEDDSADMLSPHGLQWRPIPAEAIIADQRGARVKPSVNWANINIDCLGGNLSGDFSQADAMLFETRRPLHYFLLAFPLHLVHPVIDRTNAKLPGDAKPLSVQTFFRFFGIVYAMALVSWPRRRDYFGKRKPGDATERLFPPPNFGRFMGESEFERWLAKIAWSGPRQNDAFWAVRDWFNGFNERRRTTLIPSDRIVIDESMSANRTNRTVTLNVPHGLPHQTKLERKPKGVGSEIRTALDGESQVMLRLDLQESKAAMQTKKFVEETGSSGTACVLRLTEPWFRTGRTVYGDSAFGSVNTAMHVRRQGNHFIGMVKTASTMFPKKYLRGIDGLHRTGASRYLDATKDGIQLYAVGWWDKALKTMIATCGSNADAPPHRRKRYRLDDNGNSVAYEKETPISGVPHEYFSYAQLIDVHNHRRQGVLALEEALRTQNWVVRLLSTLWGMILVDAYALYVMDMKWLVETDAEQRTTMTFADFHEEVALKLCTNTLDARGRKRRNDDETDDDNDGACDLARIQATLDEFGLKTKRKRKQVRCKVCGELASYCCARCSTPANLVALCGASTIRDVPCLSVHRREVGIVE